MPRRLIKEIGSTLLLLDWFCLGDGNALDGFQ